MYAISFDMRVAEIEARHPRCFPGGYAEIERVTKGAGFYRVQGSVFVSEKPDLSCVTRAMVGLRDLPWFSASVRDIRAFKVEDWSDFTSFFKGSAA